MSNSTPELLQINIFPVPILFSPLMKHPMYVLFALVLLIATGTTLSYIVVFRRDLTNSPSIRLETKLSSPYLNATLLRYAETDLAKDRFEQEVNEFLQANFSKPWRRNSSWIKFPNVNVKFMLHPMFNQIWLESRKVLTSWFTNKRFQPEIMSELISLVKHPIDNYSGHVEELHRRYSTCAVVGNSGILLEKEYGDLIDSHEVVIRLKNARIEGFQNNVGSKTSISFMNSNRIHRCARKTGCFCHPYGEEVPIVMYTSRPVHFLDYLLCKSSHKAPLLVTDARFDLLCARIVKYYSLKRFVEETGKPPEKWGPAHKGIYFHYSSGMQAVMLALGICDSVSIFGFGKSATAKHHYHTNQTTELYIHDYEAEYAFYDDLVNRPQVIPFLTDSFKIPPVLVYR